MTYTPTKHSNVVGGSSAGRVLNCPASVKLVQQMPPQPESPFAAEGTALHNAIEHALYEGLELHEVQDMVGMTFYGHELTSDMVEGALVPAYEMFWDYIERIEREDGGDAVYAVEQQVQFPGIDDAFGTADIVGHTPKRSFVWDWKFGAGVAVSAEGNSQQQYYATGAATSLPLLFLGEGKTWEHMPETYPVDLIIAQPRISEEPSIWTTSPVALDEFEDRLKDAVDEALHAEDPAVHRGDHCRWCTAQPICPAYRKMGEKLAEMAAGHGAGPTRVEPDGDKLVAKTVLSGNTITPELLAQWLAQADIVELWAASIRALSMDEAKAGRPPAGMKLVDKEGNLAYVDNDDTKIDKMLANKGLTAAERRKVKPITPTQANGLLKKAGKKPLTNKQAKRFVTGVSLVSVDDPRPAHKSTEEIAKNVAAKLAAER